MSMLWYEKLGFRENPFSIKPAVYDDELFGYTNEMRRIYTAVRKGGVWFIEGNFGVGKTSILKHIINNFRGKKRVIYYSANRSDGGIDFKKLLLNRKGFFQRWFSILPRKMILLLDEADKLNENDAQSIENYMKRGNIRSVVLSSDKLKNVKLTPYLRRRIGSKHVLQLKTVTDASAIKMVRNRIGDLKFVTNKMILKIFNKSAKNPRTMFEHLEDVCRFAVESGAKRVRDEHITKVITK
ncbi:ATP-binding protein [Candidatus Woesearchaeota archaeon]|nr:ATP-binding protein [Candidatus Woesearchaeota archaeon]